MGFHLFPGVDRSRPDSFNHLSFLAVAFPRDRDKFRKKIRDSKKSYVHGQRLERVEDAVAGGFRLFSQSRLIHPH